MVLSVMVKLSDFMILERTSFGSLELFAKRT